MKGLEQCGIEVEAQRDSKALFKSLYLEKQDRDLFKR
jgi:hypothetical protein